MKENPIWLLIDGNNQVVTTAHGARGDCEAAPRYVFNRIERLVNFINPLNVITAWDTGRTFRHDLLPGYKAGRSRLDGIDTAIQTTKRMLEDAGHRNFVSEGFEADDIIATCCKDALEAGCNAVIYSADADLHQLLVRDHVSQLLHAKFDRRDGDELQWITATKLFEKYGITPSQWVDYRCLVGDESDKVKGVPTIGPKTAGDILAACGTLNRFYEEPFRAPITERQHSKMMNAKDHIDLLRQIFTLIRDVPIETPVGAI